VEICGTGKEVDDSDFDDNVVDSNIYTHIYTYSDRGAWRVTMQLLEVEMTPGRANGKLEVRWEIQQVGNGTGRQLRSDR